MPLYEYTCTNKKCNHTQELRRNVGDREKPIRCDKCKNVSVHIISRTGEPQFRGANWTPKHYPK